MQNFYSSTSVSYMHKFGLNLLIELQAENSFEEKNAANNEQLKSPKCTKKLEWAALVNSLHKVYRSLQREGLLLKNRDG